MNNAFRILFLLCVLQHLSGFAQYDEAKQRRVDSIEKILPQLTDTNLVIAYNKLSNYYAGFDPDKALTFARTELNAARRCTNANWAMNGWIDYLNKEHMFGSHDSVIKHHTEMLESALKLGQLRSYCACLLTTALSYGIKGDNTKEVSMLLKAAEIAEKNQLTNIGGRAYHNIGYYYMHRKEYQIAAPYFKKSIRIKEKEKTISSIPQTLLSLGVCFAEMNQIDSSRYYFLKAADMAKISDDLGIVARVNDNLGNLLVMENKYDEALKYYQSSIAARIKMGDKHGICIGYTNIGGLYGTMGDHKKALQYLEKAIVLTDELNDKTGSASLYLNAAREYEYVNDLKNAYNYAIKYGKLLEQTFHENTSKQIAEMNTKYETEKKESQIALLNKESEFKNIELKQHQKLSMLVSCVGVLFLILAVALFIGFRNKRKANALLNKLNGDLELSKVEIEHQKDRLFEKNTEILDSIRYAKRIQSAQLPSDKYITRSFTRLKKS